MTGPRPQLEVLPGLDPGIPAPVPEYFHSPLPWATLTRDGLVGEPSHSHKVSEIEGGRLGEGRGHCPDSLGKRQTQKGRLKLKKMLEYHCKEAKGLLHTKSS